MLGCACHTTCSVGLAGGWRHAYNVLKGGFDSHTEYVNKNHDVEDLFNAFVGYIFLVGIIFGIVVLAVLVLIIWLLFTLV